MTEQILYPEEIKGLQTEYLLPAEETPKSCNELSLNCIMCLRCNNIIVSEDGDDLKWCKCHTVAIHGGNNYLRRTGIVDKDYEELSIWKP